MWVPILLIVGGILAIYSNTWRSPFVLDDVHLIVEDEARRTLYFTVERLFGSRSLPVLSFDLNYYFNGLSVGGYHVVNILIHIVTSIGVFGLGYLLSVRSNQTRIITLGPLRISNHLILGELAALFFALHPIQTQAVTYIVQRLASMTAMFYVLSLWTYLKFRLAQDQRGKKVWAGLSLAAAIAAMHCKETAITLPIIILLIELIFFLPKRQGKARAGIDWRKMRRNLFVILPWVLTIFIIPAYMLEVRDLIWQTEGEPSSLSGDTFFDKVNVERVAAASVETTKISRTTYLLTQINVVRTYLRLVAWPTGQNIDHDYPLTLTLNDRATVWSLILHGMLIGVAILLLSKGRKIPALGIIFFYIALLPESSFFPIIDVIFEHRLYLPMIGAALLVGDVGQMVLVVVNKKVKRSRITETWLVCLCLVGVVGLAVASYERNKVWKDEVTLWTDAKEKAPNKARPHNNLGKAFLDRRMFGEAEALYKRELEIDPKSVSAHNNLGSIYGVQGRYEEAIGEVQEALAISPNHDAAYNNLGNVLMMQGKLAAAEEAYRTSISLNTKDAGVWRNLGDVLVKQEKYEEAIEAYRQAINMVPGEALWHSKLGAALGAVNRMTEARTELEKALQLNPRLAPAYGNLGNVLANQGEYESAARAYIFYLQLEKGDTAVMSNLAKVFIKLGNNKKAEEIWQAILAINPNHEEARKYMTQLERP